MHATWNEIGMFNGTEKRLVDQKNNILKRKCLSDLELEEIHRNIEDVENGEVGLESDEDEVRFLRFDHEGLDMFMKKCELALANCTFLKKNWDSFHARLKSLYEAWSYIKKKHKKIKTYRKSV